MGKKKSNIYDWNEPSGGIFSKEGTLTESEKKLIADDVKRRGYGRSPDRLALKVEDKRKLMKKLRKLYEPSEKMKLKSSIKKKQTGGYLKGPSHKKGGIAAVIGGKEPVELEGGEYIIRKSSVDKLGKDTLDEINKKGRIPAMAKGGTTATLKGRSLKIRKKKNPSRKACAWRNNL